MNADELRKLAMAATPGPWMWDQNEYHVWLCTPDRGRLIVMDFVRKGMQRAQPRFSDRGNERRGGIMYAADEIGNLYTNPDAAYIAAANPAAVLELLDENDHLRSVIREAAAKLAGHKPISRALTAAFIQDVLRDLCHEEDTWETTNGNDSDKPTNT